MSILSSYPYFSSPIQFTGPFSSSRLELCYWSENPDLEFSSDQSYLKSVQKLLWANIFSLEEDYWLLKQIMAEPNKPVNEKLLQTRPGKSSKSYVHATWVHKSPSLESVVQRKTELMKNAEMKNRVSLLKLEIKTKAGVKKGEKKSKLPIKEKTEVIPVSPAVERNGLHDSYSWMNIKPVHSIQTIALVDKVKNLEFLYPLHRDDVAQCRYFANLKCSEYDVYGNPKIVLDVNSDEFKQLAKSAAFDPNTMNQFAYYLTLPNSEDIDILAKEIKQLEMVDLKRRVQMDLETEKYTAIHKLEQVVNFQLKQSELMLQAKLERDIQSLKEQFQLDLSLEREKWNSCLQVERDRVEQFYDKEKENAGCSVDSIFHNVVTERKVCETIFKTRSDIVSSDCAGPLLCLAWIVQCDILIEDAATRIANNLPFFMNQSWCKSPVVTENIHSEECILSFILSKVSENTLFTMVNEFEKEGIDEFKPYPINFHDFFLSECKIRMARYLEILEKMSLPRISEEYSTLTNTLIESGCRIDTTVSKDITVNTLPIAYRINNKLTLAAESLNDASASLVLRALDKFQNQRLKNPFSKSRNENLIDNKPYVVGRLKEIVKLLKLRENMWQSVKFNSTMHVRTQPKADSATSQVVDLLAVQNYYTVHADRVLFSQNGGKFYFEVTISALDHLSTLIIGWDAPRSVLDRVIPGFTPCFDNWLGISGCAWQNSGIFYHNGNSYTSSSKFKVGDVVGLAIDLDHHLLFFTLNGIPVCINTHDACNTSEYEGIDVIGNDQINSVQLMVHNIAKYFSDRPDILAYHFPTQSTGDEDIANDLSLSLLTSIQSTVFEKDSFFNSNEIKFELLSLLPKTHALYLNSTEIAFYRKFSVPIARSLMQSNKPFTFSLVPAICMYSAKNKPKATVHVNWEGPFKYPFGNKFFPVKYLAPIFNK